MAEEINDATIAASLRRHLVVAGFACMLLIGGLGGWSATASISGAVIAPGTITVKGHSKKIQHRDGGIVRTINVREGDKVEAGQLLLELDSTDTGANLAVIDAQLIENLGRETRLQAEFDGAESFRFPAALVASTRNDDRRLMVLSGQKALFESRHSARQGRHARIEEQIEQFSRQIEGLEAQRHAKADENRLIEDELVDLTGLLHQGLVTKTRMTALQREHARVQGDHGGLVADIARIGGAIAEKRLEIVQIDEGFSEEVLDELQEVRNQIARLREQRITALDRFERSRLYAPYAGIVHQLAVHTEGGVIAPGETVMLIVPHGDALVISAKVQTTDIDQLHVGQPAFVRLSGLDQRLTPEIEGELTTISADLTADIKSGESFYSVELTIKDGELEKLGDTVLVPGMPTEVFLKTTSRTVLSFVTQPLTDQIARAFRQ